MWRLERCRYVWPAFHCGSLCSKSIFLITRNFESVLGTGSAQKSTVIGNFEEMSEETIWNSNNRPNEKICSWIWHWVVSEKLCKHFSFQIFPFITSSVILISKSKRSFSDLLTKRPKGFIARYLKVVN